MFNESQRKPPVHKTRKRTRYSKRLPATWASKQASSPKISQRCTRFQSSTLTPESTRGGGGEVTQQRHAHQKPAAPLFQPSTFNTPNGGDGDGEEEGEEKGGGRGERGNLFTILSPSLGIHLRHRYHRRRRRRRLHSSTATARPPRDAHEHSVRQSRPHPHQRQLQILRHEVEQTRPRRRPPLLPVPIPQTRRRLGGGGRRRRRRIASTITPSLPPLAGSR